MVLEFDLSSWLVESMLGSYLNSSFTSQLCLFISVLYITPESRFVALLKLGMIHTINTLFRYFDIQYVLFFLISSLHQEKRVPMLFWLSYSRNLLVSSINRKPILIPNPEGKHKSIHTNLASTFHLSQQWHPPQKCPAKMVYLLTYFSLLFGKDFVPETLA